MVALLGVVACSSGAGAHRDLARAASPRALPSAAIAAPDAPPRILGVWLSSLAAHSGDHWSGRIVTTTNVASVEVRSPAFTFNAHRTSFGEFDFDEHVLFVTPVYRRVYTVAIVARNAAGIADERTVRVDFR